MKMKWKRNLKRSLEKDITPTNQPKWFEAIL